MKACITCKHCDVLEKTGESFLVCDLGGDEKLKFIDPKGICPSYEDSIFLEVLDFDIGEAA